MQDAIQRRFQIASTGKHCTVHPHHELLNIDGTTLCTICETDKHHAEFEAESTKRINQALNSRFHRMLDTQSIAEDASVIDCTFSSYEVTTPEEAQVKEQATEVYKAIKSNLQGNTPAINAWFTGEVGAGKSHLAMAILRNINEMGEKKQRCVYVSVSKMMQLVRGSFDDKGSKYTESYCVELCSEADVLVLDDLGTETGAVGSNKQATDFVHRMLNAIVNARAEKCTIITTNHTAASLVTMYDKRIVSRMSRNHMLVRFENICDKRMNSFIF